MNNYYRYHVAITLDGCRIKATFNVRSREEFLRIKHAMLNDYPHGIEKIESVEVGGDGTEYPVTLMTYGEEDAYYA